MSLLRIDKLFIFEKGTLQSSKCTPGNYTFITASSEWKTHNVFTHDCEALIFAAAASGSLGRTHYVKGKFISSDLCFIITPKDPINFPIDLKFYHILFNELKDEIVRNTKAGTSKEAIGLGNFGRYEVPYFIMATQTEIKNRFVKAEEFKENLSNEFFHQLTLVKQLRQAYLREAMQGKLVPPNLSDGDARELLQQIKAEKQKLIARKKLKKEKELPPIKENDVPFEIPENWVWCRLGEILDKLTDYHANGAYEKLKSNVEMFDTENYAIMLRTTNFHLKSYYNYKYITREAYNFLEKSKVYPGDVIMNKIGDPGSVFFVDERDKPMSLAMNLFLLRFKSCISNSYTYSYLKMQQEYIKTFSAGTTNLTITKDAVKEILFPLPPLPIQQRIEKKLEQLMKICDEFQYSIQQSKVENEKLLQQVLREALRKEEVEA